LPTRSSAKAHCRFQALRNVDASMRLSPAIIEVNAFMNKSVARSVDADSSSVLDSAARYPMNKR
jgi:hypothetical protein